ncbi:GNAT family N-acetyltransferase [Arthrobacter antioxidans]|uniref:GNAT family N-acetyltransferase n=1 Tax=Arthrobacter antioxidans TaxID=2895818 RepID=UPI001FFED089|nr:N-acetyltransferase [Arthrobacter antioxidans]
MRSSSFADYRTQTAQAVDPQQFGMAAVPEITRNAAARPDDAGFPADLSTVSNRQLRVLCNQTYRMLDRDFPAMEAVHHYELLVEEIERREVQAETRSEPTKARGGFRDNSLFSRFELFSDGTMVGHVKYEMKGPYAVLIQAVVDPQFDPVDVEPALIRRVLLNAHQRRIAVVPYCPRVREFLREFPQYRALLPVDQRKRLEAALLVSADA